MKKTLYNIFFASTVFLIFNLIFLISAKAQTDQERIEQLREQIEQLEAQSKLYRNNIASEQAKAKTLATEIATLKNQISNLETQVRSTGKKIDKTILEVDVLSGQIFDTQSKIAKQKSSIGRLMLFINRQDKQPLLATLLKNANISEFYQQNQYAQNLNQELFELMEDLDDTRSALENDKRELEEKKKSLEQLKLEQTAKKSALSTVRYEKDDLLKKTKGQEAAYQKQLTTVERQIAEFFTELQKLEKEAVEGGLYIVHITATNIPPKGTNIFSWPYPAGDYRITQGYGMTSYARRGAYGGQAHSGIDIASGFGSIIKPIGSGEVVAIGNNKGFGNWVAIKHDNNMVSIYGHLSSFAGQIPGARVTTDTIIGFEGSTGNSTGSHVHLSLYKDFFTYEKNGQLYFNYIEGTINPLDYLP